MKRKERKITDMNFDVLIHIMLHLSKSSSGAENLLRTSAVCRIFKELAEDPMILGAVTFNDVQLSEIHESFWKRNGLLFRCMRAGNLSAFLIAFNYMEELGAFSKIIHGNFRQAAMTLRLSSMEVQIVNTRARRRAFIQAIDDLCSVYDSAEKCYMKTLAFSTALTEAIKTACA